MKIFLDTADTSLIEHHYHNGLIDGVTTNPTLIMKSGRDPESVYAEILELGIKDLSMEVVGTRNEMMVEGRRLAAKFGRRATIKLPCTKEGLFVCKDLNMRGIKTNVTLIFSVAQAILASHAGATYVSPFVGRVDDNSFDGIKLIEEIKTALVMDGSPTDVLAASIRSVRQVTDSVLAGADIVTMPPSVLDGMYKHILTDKGLEQFDKDWKQVYN